MGQKSISSVFLEELDEDMVLIVIAVFCIFCCCSLYIVDIHLLSDVQLAKISILWAFQPPVGYLFSCAKSFSFYEVPLARLISFKVR